MFWPLEASHRDAVQRGRRGEARFLDGISSSADNFFQRRVNSVSQALGHWRVPLSRRYELY
jgi:hypothetical protein